VLSTKFCYVTNLRNGQQFARNLPTTDNDSTQNENKCAMDTSTVYYIIDHVKMNPFTFIISKTVQDIIQKPTKKRETGLEQHEDE